MTTPADENISGQCGHGASRGKVTKWLAMSIMAAAFGSSFLFGYNVGVMNAPQNVFGLWVRDTMCRRAGREPDKDEGESDHEWCSKLNPAGELVMFKENVYLNTIWALSNSFIPGGAVVGALISPYFARRFGPKKSMLLNNVIAIAAVLLNALAFSAGAFEMLIAGRFLAGVNSGVSAGITPSYLTEVAPANLRGMAGSFHQLFIIISMFFAQILGLPYIFGNATLWPLLLAMAALPSVYQLITLPLCPDSPKYLLFTRRHEEAARAVLVKLRGTTDVGFEMDEMRNDYNKIKDDPAISMKDLFTDPFLRRTLLIGIGLMAAHQFSGIDAVAYYSTAIYQGSGLTELQSVYGTIGTGAANLLMSFVSVILIEKASRRTLLLIGDFGMIIFLVLLTVFMLLFRAGAADPKNPAAENAFGWAAYGNSASLIGFVVMFAAGPGAIPWIMMAELFSTRARPSAAGVLAASNRFCSLLVTISYPYLQAAIKEYSFVIFAGSLCVAWVFTYFLVIETKGISEEEIQKVLRSKMPKQNESVEMAEIRDTK